MRSKGISTRKINLLVGWLLYPLGDLLGQVLLGRFSLERTGVITLLGGLLYRFEIPRWFLMLDNYRPASKAILLPFTNKSGPRTGHLNWLGRTLGAMAYFNPLWIARHVFFIYLATHQFQLPDGLSTVLIDCLKVGWQSFLANLPISLLGNYLIQEKLPYQYRFAGSAGLSAFMASLYALEYWFFQQR